MPIGFRRFKTKAPVINQRTSRLPRVKAVDTAYVPNDQGGLSVLEQAVEYDNSERPQKRARREDATPEAESVTTDAQWEDIPMDAPSPIHEGGSHEQQHTKNKGARVRTPIYYIERLECLMAV